jgi:Domain of unknown function (DUF4436)
MKRSSSRFRRGSQDSDSGSAAQGLRPFAASKCSSKNYKRVRTLICSDFRQRNLAEENRSVTLRGTIDVLPLSLFITLLFGLPALRNSQPAVPPLAAFGDYLSFLWAEQIIAVSAVVMIWSWLVRERRTIQGE